MAGLFGPLAFFAAAMTGAPASEAVPIRLAAEPVGEGVRLTVIGDSDVAMTARYSLEVVASEGGNRSVQRGEAHLQPGRAATLATVTLGQADRGWSAILKVSPEGGAAYERSAASTNR
ncbi:curli-like amyloid fiber formation chaperone CsgH [Sphingosinicella humi]|uniref:Curli assembly protein CsgC n=1 Tax=Allosphingosinicella humi TaxID=2068657 RepID=A0A2U2J0P7_9SPHN|nr:curli-like amyloid fiber formation chaperone CsgH [Sphingosinicella humi]PWG01909.1 hypothetical protein DF286_02745 [Sphingosinicella humi]